jgi:hypothetical protein
MKYASPCFTIKQPTKITVEGATRRVELQVSKHPHWENALRRKAHDIEQLLKDAQL